MTDGTGWGGADEQRREGYPTGRPGPGGARPPAPKPGVVPLRPLGVGEILDGAVSYIRAHPGATLGLAAVVIAVTQLTSAVLQSFLGPDPDVAATANSVEDVVATATAAGSAGLVGGVITFIAVTVLTGLLIVVLSRAVLGQPASLGEVWETAKPRVPGLLGLTLLVGLIVVAVLLIGAIPGGVVIAVGGGGGATVALGVLLIVAAVLMAIYVAVLLVMATPVYMLEGIEVRAALSRSRSLVRGSWWRIFGILLLAGIIAAVITVIIGIPFGLLAALASPGDPFAASTSLVGLLITAIGGIIAGILTTPFSAGVTGLLYIDQRMRREGFDLELARSAAR